LTSFTTCGWEDNKLAVEHTFLQQLVHWLSSGVAHFTPLCGDIGIDGGGDE